MVQTYTYTNKTEMLLAVTIPLSHLVLYWLKYNIAIVRMNPSTPTYSRLHD
jgi:hypothetical protein